MRRFMLVAGLTALLGFVLVAPLSAGSSFPEVIPLPKGFQPEGIATKGTTFYVGAIQNGSIFRGDVRTGTGSVLVPARSGRMATGMKVDRRNRLFVAGAFTGQAYVYDARTGADIAFYQLTASPSFINDVIVTKSAAYFTDSFSSVLYRIPIGRNGQLGATAQPVPLIGVVSVPGQFNVNGIDATPDGETLVIVQSNTGKLFTVDPDTGVAREINLGGQNVVNGDGLLLDGRTLYVVENFDNRVAVVQLDRRLTRGTIVTYLTHPSLDIPTTVADVGRRLYVPNARFTTPATPATDYWVTQLRKPSGDDGDDEQGDNDEG